MHPRVTIGRMLVALLLLLSFKTSATSLEADVHDRLEAELLSLKAQFFEGDEARIEAFVKEGIEHGYGPAWFVRAARNFLHVEGDGQELKSAVFESLSHGIGSAGPLLSFAVTKSDNPPSEDVVGAERALAGMEHVSIVGEAHSIFFFRSLVIAFPQADPDKQRFLKFVERQYGHALGRGSTLAVAFGLNEGKPSARRVQQLCAILRKTRRDETRRCKAAREAANGTVLEVDGEVLKKNAATFRVNLIARFGHVVESYERAVCSSLPPGDYREVACTDYVAAAISLCSIRTEESKYTRIKDTLVCRKNDVEGFGIALSQIVDSVVNSETEKN